MSFTYSEILSLHGILLMTEKLQQSRIFFFKFQEEFRDKYHRLLEKNSYYYNNCLLFSGMVTRNYFPER